MRCVNTQNWTYCRFQKGDFMALITLGADPMGLDENRLEYYVTVLESEIHEVFQETFSSLADACMFLNANYGDWTFEDQTAPKTGCSTCAAH
jgi:hypothetical protein